MLWRTLTSHTRIAQSAKRLRHIGTALALMGLALAVAACGSSTGGGGGGPTSTPTSKPTATPIPCASWRIVSSPTNARYPMSMLSAVSALSPSAAWAVGVNYAVGDTIGPLDSLIEQWDGATWRIVANTGHSALNDITAISPRDIWAVGGRLNDGVGDGSLTMHWNGMTWSVVPGANLANASFVSLNGVAAVTANDVWAVGQQTPLPDPLAQSLAQPLIERWDGATWRIVNSPLPQSAAPTKGAILTAVTRIPGTNQLWAVGGWTQYVNTAPPHPLIERWDGAAWQIIASPALPDGAMGGSWDGVVALSATNAWAVGHFAVKNPMDSHPLIGHWDGTHWQIVLASPDTYGELNSVAAAGANDVRAAGSLLTGPGASSGDGRRIPLIEQWNGTAWQTMTSPEPPNGVISGQIGVATDGAGNYWAAGSYLNAKNANQTVTLHCP